MDRKLFFSYIQNMQTNNPDMIGFQNSMTKNSWQKPKSIVETNNKGRAVKLVDGELVYTEFNRIADAAEEAAKEAYNNLIPQIEGPFHGFVHNPDKANSGVETFTASSGDVLYPIDAGTHLHGHLPRGLSDEEAEEAQERFIDAINKRHESEMRGQQAVGRYEADEDLRDTQAHTLHRQGIILPKAP
jgi:hypothetical protein